MRTMIATLVLAAGLPAFGQTVTDVPAIRDTIAGQLDAFKADDLARAFGYASPGIRDMFGTPETFGAMVRNGYPSIWRPSRVIYFDQKTEGAIIVQRMGFVDAAGKEHWYGYEMKQVGGAWKINAVYPIDAPDVGV